MKPLRIAAIFLVISIGLIGSYLILRNATPLTADKKAPEISQILNSLDKNPIQWLEKAAESDANPVQGLADLNQFLAENREPSKTENKNSVNLTELVAKSMFSRMKDLDQSSQNPFQSSSFNPDDPEAQKLLAEAVASINEPALLFSQNIGDKDLKILNDNSREIKIEYLEAVRRITESRFNDLKYQRTASEVIKDIESDCLGSGTPSLNRETALLYQNLVNDYLNLGVPREWLDLHKGIIAHFENSHLIYQAFADCSLDPIKGYLATQALPPLMERAQEIQNSLAQKYKEMGFE